MQAYGIKFCIMLKNMQDSSRIMFAVWFTVAVTLVSTASTDANTRGLCDGKGGKSKPVMLQSYNNMFVYADDGHNGDHLITSTLKGLSFYMESIDGVTDEQLYKLHCCDCHDENLVWDAARNSQGKIVEGAQIKLYERHSLTRDWNQGFRYHKDSGYLFQGIRDYHHMVVSTETKEKTSGAKLVLRSPLKGAYATEDPYNRWKLVEVE